MDSYGKRIPWKGKALPISSTDYAAAARTLNVSVPVIRAVFEVEAAGRFYRSDGTVERRFEPHHFQKARWGEIGFAPGKLAPWRASLAIKKAQREAMFTKAYALNPDSAMSASSWGAPQIMGLNHLKAGYPTARGMVEDMADRAAAHLDAFAAFCLSSGLQAALRGHDWLTFATIYNGNGQAPEYARQIETAYRRHSGKPSAVVLSLGSQGEDVKELQRALGSDPDGMFGPKTREAVIAYQKRKGLSPDGVVGDKTWDMLRAEKPEVKPSAQPTQADVVGKVTAASGAATAVAGAVATVGDALPDMAMNILIGGATVAGLVAIGAFVFVKVRERV